MVKKITISFVSLSVVLAALLSGCQYFPWLQEKAQVSVSAVLTDSAGSRAVNPGDVVTTIDSYQVVFSKVEIGNSEEDKFTLWENSAGETKDVATTVSFGDATEVLTGSYNYVRLTIGENLEVTGSIDDNGTVYSGQGSCLLEDIVYLWGTDIGNWNGEVTIREPIVIDGDCILAFTFDVTGTVTYEGGPASGAVLSVQKPVLNVDVIAD